MDPCRFYPQMYHFNMGATWKIGKPFKNDYQLRKNEIFVSAKSSYLIAGYVNRGTFGQVAKAIKLDSGTPVAIKVLQNKQICRTRASFENNLMEYLKQNNAEKFFMNVNIDYFEHNDHPCFVSQLLSISLYRFLYKEYRRPIPLYGIRAILFQLLNALQKLKQHGIVHSDIKPDNIMLVDHVRFPFLIKLIDFGSAMKISGKNDYAYIQSRFYRAPEILIGCEFNESVDMWSVGCVAAELLLMKPIFPGGNEFQQLGYIVQLQGMPTGYMLNKGGKVMDYFHCSTRKFWKLKSTIDYYANLEAVPEDVEVAKLTTAVIFRNMKAWGIPDSEINEQITDFDNFMDILDSTLTIDPVDRICPLMALNHHFFKYSDYLPSVSQSWNLSQWVMCGVYNHMALPRKLCIPTKKSNSPPFREHRFPSQQIPFSVPYYCPYLPIYTYFEYVPIFLPSYYLQGFCVPNPYMYCHSGTTRTRRRPKDFTIEALLSNFDGNDVNQTQFVHQNFAI